MTRVLFKKISGDIVSFTIKGHSGFADQGEDIVCSAISALSVSIANGITEILKVKAEPKVKDGFLSLSLEDLTSEDIDKCQVLLETLLLGMKNIELMYSGYIKVSVEEV